MKAEDNFLLELTVEVVSAYAGNNTLPTAQLPEIIQSVHRSLRELSSDTGPLVVKAAPAVSVRRSVRADAIVCLECGTEHKMIKRHLKTAHDLSVADYREKWELKSDYPLVAPNYAKQRSELAKRFGLGRKSS
jgi:predicted transcriptional regulator